MLLKINENRKLEKGDIISQAHVGKPTKNWFSINVV